MSLEWWKSFFEIGGVILILLTFAFGAGALIVNSRLGALQDAQLRQFDTKLTDAKIELGKQQVLAAEASAKVSGLEEDVSAAKTEMAKQQARAATAEKALLELQQRLAHRRISPSEHDKFVAALSPYPGSAVALHKILVDSEASQFADDIIGVFKDAQWHIVLNISGQVTPTPYKLECLVDDKTAAGKALMGVLSALPTANIRRVSRTGGTVAEIVVGLRPPA